MLFLMNAISSTTSEEVTANIKLRKEIDLVEKDILNEVISVSIRNIFPYIIFYQKIYQKSRLSIFTKQSHTQQDIRNEAEFLQEEGHFKTASSLLGPRESVVFHRVLEDSYKRLKTVESGFKKIKMFDLKIKQEIDLLKTEIGVLSIYAHYILEHPDLTTARTTNLHDEFCHKISAQQQSYLPLPYICLNKFVTYDIRERINSMISEHRGPLLHLATYTADKKYISILHKEESLVSWGFLPKQIDFSIFIPFNFDVDFGFSRRLEMRRMFYRHLCDKIVGGLIKQTSDVWSNMEYNIWLTSPWIGPS